MRKLQISNVLVYGKNIKTITSDNGNEFWDWEIFRKSIYNKRDDLEVYFTNPYSSWEKGGVEHFNGQIRRKFPKWTETLPISHKQI